MVYCPEQEGGKQLFGPAIRLLQISARSMDDKLLADLWAIAEDPNWKSDPWELSSLILCVDAKEEGR